MSAPELLDLDATALAGALRAGDVSPVEVLDATLDAAAGVGAAVGAFTVLTPDLARTQALAAQDALVAARRDGRAGPRDGLPPFLGVPCPVKDLT
ncbi:MAG: amidase, partial [Cellulosimicrobium funkei]